MFDTSSEELSSAKCSMFKNTEKRVRFRFHSLALIKPEIFATNHQQTIELHLQIEQTTPSTDILKIIINPQEPKLLPIPRPRNRPEQVIEANNSEPPVTSQPVAKPSLSPAMSPSNTFRSARREISLDRRIFFGARKPRYFGQLHVGFLTLAAQEKLAGRVKRIRHR